MMRKLLLNFPIVVLTILCLSACFSSKEGGNVSSQRVSINKHGIILDASYDPRLDNLVNGYKIMTVVVTNNGFDVLRLNPLKDKWEVVDAMGKTHKAINSLRIKDPSTFSQLPSKLQQYLDYPVGVSMGYSETVDLLFSNRINLKAFRSISFYSEDRKQTFDMLSNLDSPTHVPATKQAVQPESRGPDPKFQ